MTTSALWHHFHDLDSGASSLLLHYQGKYQHFKESKEHLSIFFETSFDPCTPLKLSLEL